MHSLGDYAVAIHGCHLQAEEWRRIVFGDEKKWGRVPVGILAALEHNAELIFWGTGASSIQTPTGPMLEGEYTYSQTLGPELEQIAVRVNRSAAELASYLKRVSVINRDSMNTAEEVSAVIRECQERGIKNLILISSPTHIARCLQTSCILVEEARDRYEQAAARSKAVRMKNQELEAEIARSGPTPDLRKRLFEAKWDWARLKEDTFKAKQLYKNIPTIYARYSDTCYAGSRASDTVAIEPDHRGDLPKAPIPIHELAKRVLALRRKNYPAFCGYIRLWDALTRFFSSNNALWSCSA